MSTLEKLELRVKELEKIVVSLSKRIKDLEEDSREFEPDAPHSIEAFKQLFPGIDQDIFGKK